MIKKVSILIALLLLSIAPKYSYAFSIYKCEIDEMRYEYKRIPILQKDFQFEYHSNRIILGPINGKINDYKAKFVIQEKTIIGNFLAENRVGTLVFSDQYLFFKTRNNDSSIKASCEKDYLSNL